MADTNLTLREFWKSHSNILHCRTLLHKSWQEVSIHTLQAARQNLWPSLDRDRDFKGSEPAGSSVVEDVISVGRSLGLNTSWWRSIVRSQQLLSYYSCTRSN